MADETSDYLKNEEENDPVKITKEQMELQKEGIKLMREALAKKPPQERTSYIATSDYLHPPEPRSIDFQVRKIENGWIIACFKDQRGGIGPYSDKAIETYCQTAEELVKATAAQVEAFTKEATAPAASDGPPPFQLAPGEAI